MRKPKSWLKPPGKTRGEATAMALYSKAKVLEALLEDVNNEIERVLRTLYANLPSKSKALYLCLDDEECLKIISKWEGGRIRIEKVVSKKPYKATYVVDIFDAKPHNIVKSIENIAVKRLGQVGFKPD